MSTALVPSAGCSTLNRYRRHSDVLEAGTSSSEVTGCKEGLCFSSNGCLVGRDDGSEANRLRLSAIFPSLGDVDLLSQGLSGFPLLIVFHPLYIRTDDPVVVQHNLSLIPYLNLPLNMSCGPGL